MIGVGGGTLLISIMPIFFPISAVVPIHGAVQFTANASRTVFSLKQVKWSFVFPFVAGGILGASIGMQFLNQIPTSYAPILLGSFILLFTWTPKKVKIYPVPGRFFSMGLTQTFLSLFIGVTGPLTNAFLLREGLTRDHLVATHGMLMTATHLLKVLVFSFISFSFVTHLKALCVMMIAVTLGSYVGTFFRGKLPQHMFEKLLRIVITILALRMIFYALSGDLR